MNQTQPNSRTLIGLIIGAIVLVAGLLLISNAGRSGTETPPPSPTRVSQQPTETPQPEPSPTPAAQTRNDEEDPDGDGFIGENDFCPDVAGTFDGCPDSDADGIPDDKDACPNEGDLGYGIDGVGCPNPPTDRDGDGIFDNDDTCPDNGDEGNGIDSVGCPIPLPPPSDTDGDGVPDDADLCPDVGDLGNGVDATGCPMIAQPEATTEPIIFPPNTTASIVSYRFENIGADDNCAVQIVNIGDGNPATLSDYTPVTPDENGVVAGQIGVLLGENDVPEAVITCIGTPPLPPAIAAFEYSFDIPSNLICTIMIVDEGGNMIDSFPAVPDENGIASGVFEYDPGVIINPSAQIGCVPNVAPAVMPYEFTGLSDVICTVTIVNTGDGDPADFGSASGLIPDENGTISGFISILLGAGDIPEAVIACVPASAPAILAYEYTDIPDVAICTVTVVNIGDGDPAELGKVDGLVADENGIISGAIGIIIGNDDVPELDLSCLLISPPPVAVQIFTFIAPDDFPPDVAFCDVVVNDANMNALQTFSNLIPDQNGAIEVAYEYEVGSVLEPLSAFIVCAIVDDFGNPEETPIVPPSLDYNLSADFQCVPLPNDARTFAQVGVNITATGNYRQGYQMTWVSGDTTVQNAIGLNLETGSLSFFVPLGTGQATGTLTLVAFDETPALIPAETWIFDAPPCAETAYVLSASPWCQRNDSGGLVYLGVLITGSGNYPLYYQATWVSGDYTYGPVTSVWNSTIPTFNLAYEPGAGMTTGTLTLVPYSSSFALMPDMTIVYDLDCTPEVETTPEPPAYQLQITASCATNPDSVTFRIEPTGIVPTGEFLVELTSGVFTETLLTTYEDGVMVFHTVVLNTGLGSATIFIASPDGTEWEADFSCDVTTEYTISATPSCGTDPASITFAVTATGTVPSDEFEIKFNTTSTEESFVYTLVADINPVFFTVQLAETETSAMLTITDSNNYQWIFEHDCSIPVDYPDVYAVYFTKDWYQNEFNGGLGAPALGYGTGPSEYIDNLIVATSVIGRAECDWTGSYLNCSYFALIDGQPQPVEDLFVPVGDYYVVEEAPIDGWVVAQGVGTFTYEQCLASNIRTGTISNPPFDVVGYCGHRVINTIPNTDSVMVVEIEKIWLVGNNFGGLDAPAEGGGYYGPNYDILGLIVATSDYGTLTCDWLTASGGGYLSCYMQFTNRPPWYDEFDELPVPAGGSYTVTENVPDGWTVLRGAGTFTIDNCTDSYTYLQYYEVDGEEFSVPLTECWHEVINQSDFVATDDFYGVQIEKIWAEEIETAMQNRGLNSPAQGGGSGPNGYYYPLIRAFSNYGEAWCDWYGGYGLECYYNSYPSAPFPAYDYLLVKYGESFTVIEVPIDGYINTRGVGTFDDSSCNFVGNIPAGRSYEGGYIELPICRHEVENVPFESDDYYRVVVEKDWYYDDDRGLRAPAQGGGYRPFVNIPNFITLESSIATGTCSWVVTNYDGNLICQFSAKDGQSMPDSSGLWVPAGEGYTITENPPDGWEATSGVGTFSECAGYSYGNTCYHRIVNTTDQLPAYRVYVAKFWQNFLCDDDYRDECYFGTASADSGLNAPLAGGFYSPGPDVFIRNIITVTSDLGSMSCDWMPRYYDAYYGITVGELECRITSMAQGYPPYYSGLWVPAGGSYTVTENLPSGYYTVFGTGTFSLDECLANGFYGGFGSANFIPVGGEYYEDGDECLHIVMNDRQDIEPTPEVTPTEEITPVVTPTEEFTPVVTPTEEITPVVTPTEEITPIVTPTEEITPIVTPTEEFTPEVTEVPSEEPTPVTPETPVPTDEPSPEPTPEGVCGDYALASDGFPIINLSNAPCGDDSEGAVVNFSPVQTGGAVCIPEALYHSNGGGTWDIWRTADGMEAENLTNNPAGIISMAPTRSPNGRYVVYASNADGDWELYLIDLDNLDAPPTQLTNNTQAIDLDPVFSPSGRFIAYESNVDGNWEIRVIDLTTGEKRRVTSHPANDINPFWHPDGDSLLFQSDRTGKWQIFSATTIAGTSTASLLSDGVGEDFDPTYSPNGERIAFRSIRNGETAIYIMDSDGTDVRKVSLDGYTASTPVWDSSNRYIAYQASKAGESLNDIFVYDTVTGETRQLTSSVGEMANVQDVAPTWLCNSTTVIFASDVSGNNRLYALNALPMSAPPVDLTGMGSWTENDFNNRDPQNTPSEENGSRMGALPPRR